MRHFVFVSLVLPPPLPPPRLAGGMVSAPARRALIPRSRLPLALLPGLPCAGWAAVALAPVTPRAHRDLAATACTEEQTVVRMRPDSTQATGES
jgi:hypothetical protein